VVIVAFIAFVYAQAAHTLEVDEQESLRSLVSQVGEEINTTAKYLSAEAEMVALMQPLQKAVQSGAPEQITGLMNDSYAALSKKYGVAVGQVNSVSNTVLHRFHQPEARGDNFTSSRKIIVAVHANKQAQGGIEIGSSGVRVRGAAPVLSEGALAGSIEFGTELRPLLETLKTRTNADFAIIMDRRLLNVRPGTPEANVFGNLKGDSGTNWPLMARLHELGKITLVKEPSYSSMTADGVTYGAVTVPLLDYSGSEIGVIVAAKSFSADGRSLRRLAIGLVAGGVIAEIGIIAIILLVFRGMVLRPLAAVTKAVEALDGGPAAELPKAGTVAEVNGLIAAVKRLRDKAAAAAVKA
jgi:methyl-accepting chemotaxis protein